MCTSTSEEVSLTSLKPPLQLFVFRALQRSKFLQLSAFFDSIDITNGTCSKFSHNYGGVNSHIQSLSKAVCVEICAVRRRRAQIFFENHLKSWRNLKISEIEVIKSLVIAYYKLRYNRSWYSLMYVNPISAGPFLAF